MPKKLKKKVLKTGKATRAEAKVVAKEGAKARPCEAVSCGGAAASPSEGASSAVTSSATAAKRKKKQVIKATSKSASKEAAGATRLKSALASATLGDAGRPAREKTLSEKKKVRFSSPPRTASTSNSSNASGAKSTRRSESEANAVPCSLSKRKKKSSSEPKSTTSQPSNKASKSTSEGSSLHGFLPLKLSADAEQTYVKTLLLRRESEQNLFVTHLDDLTEEELQTVFVNFGEVESVVVKELEHRVGYLARDGIEAKTAFALVRFAEPSALEACLAKAAETFPLLTPHIKRASDDLVKEARRRLQLLFYPDPDKLQHMYNGFMKRFEADQAAAEAEKKRRTLEPDEDGFVLVGSKNGFKPTAEDEGASSGGGRGAAGHAGGLSSLLNQADASSAVGVGGGKKKKKKKELENFYNFQVKDKRQQEMKLEERALEREKGKGVWFEKCLARA